MDTSIDKAVRLGPEVENVGVVAWFVHMVFPCSAWEEFGVGISGVSIFVEDVCVR